MAPAPIRSGAIRPLGRPSRAPIPVLVIVRLVAVAGFAFAGWMALSALDGPASAAQHSTPSARSTTPHHDRPAISGHDAASGLGRSAAFDRHRPGSSGIGTLGATSRPGQHGANAWSEGDPKGVREVGDHPVRSAESWGGVPDGSWRHDVADVQERVREIGNDPVRYLRERRHDVFDRKDRAVHELRDLTDAAGVPRVRVPDVRRAPVVGGLADRVVDSHPVLDAGLRSPDGERPEHGRVKAASGDVAAARPRPAMVVPEALAGEAGSRDTGRCAGCQQERRGPLPPVDQDDPWSGSAGGHQLAPVAELRSGRYPAVPPGVDPSTFHRTALTDVSAPGGPSVVPD